MTIPNWPSSDKTDIKLQQGIVKNSSAKALTCVHLQFNLLVVIALSSKPQDNAE